MKQRICVLLSVLLFVIAFTGCGKSDDKWIGKHDSIEQEQTVEQAELESRDLSKISEMSAAFKSAMCDPEYARYDVNVSSIAELKSQYPDLYTKIQEYLGNNIESYEEFESENCQGGTMSLRKDDSGYHASVLKNGVVVVGKSGNRMEQ